MFYVDANLEQWCKKYYLHEIDDYVCESCGKSFPLNRPIRMRGYAGLASSEHECGKQYVAYLLKPIEKDTILAWSKVSGLGGTDE